MLLCFFLKKSSNYCIIKLRIGAMDMAKQKKKRVEFDELEVRKFWVMVLLILVAGLVCFGFVYVWLIMDTKKEVTYETDVTQLEIALSNSEDATLDLIDTYPKTEAGGLSSTPYTFTLTNNGDRDAKYTISLISDQDQIEECKRENNGEDCKVIPTSAIRYSIVKNDWTRSSAILADDQNTIDMGVIEPGEDNKIQYQLKIWVDYDTTIDTEGAHFFGKLVVETK